MSPHADRHPLTRSVSGVDSTVAPNLANVVQPQPKISPINPVVGIPFKTEEQILQVLTEIRDGQDKRDTLEGLQSRHAGIERFNVARIDISSALSNARFQIGATYNLLFQEIPRDLHTLTVKLNSPSSTPINVLSHGRLIESTEVINEIYISTNPALANEQIRLITGTLKVDRWVPSAQHPSIAEARGRTAQATDHEETPPKDLQNESLTTPRSYSSVATMTTVSTQVLFEDIDTNTPFEIWGQLTVLKPSSGADVGAFKIVIKNASNATEYQAPLDIIVPETGSLHFWFRSGVMFLPAGIGRADVQAEVLALGPAANQYRILSNLILYSDDAIRTYDA